VIAGLTKFNPAQSTASQRGWIVTWLVFGQCIGIIIGLKIRDSHGYRWKRWEIAAIVIMMIIIYGAPAIGGFVIVGTMINEFGSCVVVG
jgi:MFS family permease